MNSEFNFDSLQKTALVWDWPIAIYLFLLGISVGMVTLAIMLKRQHLKNAAATSQIIKATAIVAPISVVCGLMILIFHLSMPWTFWRLLIFYSPTSVMSIGVVLFQIYMLLLIIWLAIIFHDVIGTFLGKKLQFIDKLITIMARVEYGIETALLLLAIALGAYTGFLLSALKTYPMLNNPVLPVLFLFSGISSGAAAAIFFSITLFKGEPHSNEVNFIHKIEIPVALFELFLLFAFFMGLYFGGGRKTLSAINALTQGSWAITFWLGIILIGIVLPLLFNWLSSHKMKNNIRFVLTLCGMSLFGTLLLRLFILYAGQMTLI